MHKLGMRNETGTATLVVHSLGLKSPGDSGSRPVKEAAARCGSARLATCTERSVASSRFKSLFPSLACSLASVSTANAERWSSLRRTAGESLEKDKLIGA